jgi:TATA-binding protein-associated factor Taf7
LDRIECDWLETEDTIMMDWAIAAFEVDYRTKVLEDEAEHARLLRIAKAARSEEESLRPLRRAALDLRDMAAGLSCRLQSRLSPGMDAAAC